MIKQVSVFAALSAALAAQAVELVPPNNGEEFSALLPEHREFLSKDRATRREMFLDKKWRAHIVQPEIYSNSRPLRLEWRDAEGPCEVKVSLGGTTVFETNLTANAVEVWNLEIARTYEWSVKDAKGTARGTFRTKDLAPRFINLKGVPNIRDLGGRVGLGGRRVKQGMVYRSGGLNNNADTWLSAKETMALYNAGELEAKFGADGRKVKEQIDRDKGQFKFDPKAPFLRKSLRRANPTKGKARMDTATCRYAIDKLGFKSDIDLRSDLECWGMTGSPVGPEVKWFHISSSSYGGMSGKKGREAFTEVFRIFLDEKNYPIDFHCIGGADRTGAVGFIINALLGVDDEELDKDWEITCFVYESQDFGHRTRFDKLRAVFDAYPGANTREKVENYVKDLGFTDADIARLREIMLEK